MAGGKKDDGLATLLLDGEGTVDDLLRVRPKKDSGGLEAKVLLKEAQRILEEYDKELAPRPDVVGNSQVFIRYIDDFHKVSNTRWKEDHSLAASVLHLQMFLRSFREAFLNELLLLPHAAEEFCMTIILCIDCELACLGCIEMLLVAGETIALQHLEGLCLRVLVLSKELIEVAASTGVEAWWPPDGEGSKRWPEGMAQWAKVSLVAIQKMIKDEFQAENWMATTEASGYILGLSSYTSFSAEEPRLLTRLRQQIEAATCRAVDRKSASALGCRVPVPSDLASGAAEWTQWGSVGIEARRQALGLAEQEYDL